MGDEFIHDDPGGEISQAEFIALGLHKFNSQATGDILHASSPTQLSRLGIGSTGQILKVVAGLPAWVDIATTRTLWIPAGEGYAQAGTPTYHNYGAVVEGGANLNEPIVHFTFKVPSDFVAFLSMKADWLSPAAAGNMYWAIGSNYAADNELDTTHPDTPAAAATATQGANKYNIQSPANPLTYPNLAIGDIIQARFLRLGADALDTLDDVMYLYGLLFTYAASQ